MALALRARALWHSHSVRGKTHEAKNFHHADVGSITLSYQAFDVSSAPGQQLIIYQAEPASSSEHALVLLGTIAATGRLDADAFRNIWCVS